MNIKESLDYLQSNIHKLKVLKKDCFFAVINYGSFWQIGYYFNEDYDGYYPIDDYLCIERGSLEDALETLEYRTAKIINELEILTSNKTRIDNTYICPETIYMYTLLDGSIKENVYKFTSRNKQNFIYSDAHNSKRYYSFSEYSLLNMYQDK